MQAVCTRGLLHAPAKRRRGFDAKVEVRFNGRKAPIEKVVGLLGSALAKARRSNYSAWVAQAAAAVEAVAGGIAA